MKRRSVKRRVERVPSGSSRSRRSRRSSLENKPLEFSPVYKSPDDYYLRVPLPPSSSSSRGKRGARRLSALAAQRLRKEFPIRRGLTDSHGSSETENLRAENRRLKNDLDDCLEALALSSKYPLTSSSSTSGLLSNLLSSSSSRS